MKSKKGYKPIYYNGKPSYYGINKEGKIINLKTRHEMRQRLSINGYFIVRLSFEKYKRKELFVHRLLAMYFIPNPENKPEVHHKDKNKLNNKLDNLIWVTHEEHKKLHEDDENHPFAKGGKHSGHILNDEDVHQICNYIENNIYSVNQLAKMFNVNSFVIREIKLGNNWQHISKLYDFSNYTKYEWVKTDEKVIRKICEEIESNKFSAKEIAKRNNVKIDVVERIRRGASHKDIICDYDFSKNTTIKLRTKK